MHASAPAGSQPPACHTTPRNTGRPETQGNKGRACWVPKEMSLSQNLQGCILIPINSFFFFLFTYLFISGVGQRERER